MGESKVFLWNYATSISVKVSKQERIYSANVDSGSIIN